MAKQSNASKQSLEKLVQEVARHQAGHRHGSKEARLLNLLSKGISKGQAGDSKPSKNDPEMEQFIREMMQAGML